MVQISIVQTPEEKQQVFQVRTKVFVEEQKVPLEEEIDQYDNDTTTVHFLITKEKAAVGAGRFRLVDGKGKVERICIDASLRGQGVGKQLLEHIQAYAKSKHIPVLKLSAQTHAIPFYEKLGYKVTSDTFLDAGIPHKMMEKAI